MEKKDNIKDTKEEVKKEGTKKSLENKEDKLKEKNKENKNQNNKVKNNNKDAKADDSTEKNNNDTKEKNDSEKEESQKVTESEATKLTKVEDIEIDEKKLSKINEEIKENKKNSRNNEVKKEKYIRILRNVVIAVAGIAYISINLIGANRITPEQYQVDLKVFIILSVISAILLFEKAFKSDKFRYALVGIEVLVLGGATIMLLHLYRLQNPNILKYSKYFIIIWSIYYIIKSIIILVRRVSTDKKETENN